MPASFPRGFTLVELVVVILILGILAGVAAPRFLDASREASLNATARHLLILADAAERYAAETGDWPANGGDGVMPPELEPYLRPGAFSEPCPIGGV